MISCVFTGISHMETVGDFLRLPNENQVSRRPNPYSAQLSMSMSAQETRKLRAIASRVSSQYCGKISGRLPEF